MKRLFLILFLFVACRLSAQQFVMNGGTNIVGAAVTNTYTPLLSFFQNEQMAFHLQFACTGTNSSTIAVSLLPSLDGTNIATGTTHFSWTVAANGTTPVSFATNFATGGYPYFQLRIANPNTNTASVLSNVFFIVGRK